jgi:predicted Holliday junction resolvase-like endonuclease
MSRVNMSGDIGSLLSYYKHEKNIYGRCPHCQEPFRLSEVKLTYGKEPPRDLLARLKRDRDRIKEELEQLEAQIEETEAEHEDVLDSLESEHEEALQELEDKWREKVDSAVDKRLGSRIREIRQDAVAKSRAGQLGKTLEKIAPMFPGFGHHPYDVRPVFDPVDFVIFDGYCQGEVTDITLVEFKTSQSRLTSIQNSIRAAVEKKRVHFEERRLKKETLKLLTEGASLKKQRLPRKLIE